MNKGLETKFN